MKFKFHEQFATNTSCEQLPLNVNTQHKDNAKPSVEITPRSLQPTTFGFSLDLILVVLLDTNDTASKSLLLASPKLLPQFLTGPQNLQHIWLESPQQHQTYHKLCCFRLYSLQPTSRYQSRKCIWIGNKTQKTNPLLSS